MRESPNKRAVIVGLFVLIGLIFLASGIHMVGNLHDTFKRKITVITYFEDVNGLQAGNNIWFSGLKVGTVKDIHFYSRSKVEVTMRIDVQAQEYIHKDAKVKLSTDGLIGNKILVIFGGSGDFDQIQEGDTLAVEKAVSQEEVMKILQESNKNLLSITTDFKAISKKAASGEGTVGKLLNDNSLYDNANHAIRSIQQMSLKGQQMLNNLNTYTAQLNQEGTLANDLVTDTVVFNSIRQFSQRLKQIADTTAMLVTKLKTISSDTTTSIGVLLHDKETAEHLKETLKNLESSSKKLDEDLEAAQHSWPLKKGFKRMEKEKADSVKNNPK
jgi:phospholipid/cholesterol/gamma-HCH transport system substrate-binding protein